MSLTNVRSVFYSFQSDRRASHYFLRDALQELEKKLKFNLEIAARGESGTPAIVPTILDKLATSDVVVCDITNVGKTELCRRTPNPNVLIEAGFALACGARRLLLVRNVAFGDLESLPFDLRQYAVVKFDYSPHSRAVKKTPSIKLPWQSLHYSRLKIFRME